MIAKPARWASILACAVAVAACSGEKDKRGAGGPTQVGFVVVQPTSVPMEVALDGRAVAYEVSEVRPQVSGLIVNRNFTEGSNVRRGQSLYQIDSRAYRANVDQASANVNAARATADAAQAKANRYRPLVEQEAISKQEYTDAVAQARQANANVAQQNAALRSARLNLQFTSIPAPISGRIGRSLFTPGALVTANQGDPLAVIQRIDPIYVDIKQSAADLLALRRELGQPGVGGGGTQVRLTLDDGSDYTFAGTLQFKDMMVDEATGTVTLRATFPNPQSMLLPGMFVRARFVEATNSGVFLVPQQAVIRDLGGKSAVFVVGKDNKAQRKVITTSRAMGANWVVTQGLQAGDKVITQGLNNLKSGAAIKPVPASTPERIAPRPAGQGGGGGAPGGGRGR